jgi:hypothetical protein
LCHDAQESTTLAAAAKLCGKSGNTIRSSAQRHGIGRKIGGAWHISRVARRMLLDSATAALALYHAGNRTDPTVRSYFDRVGCGALLQKSQKQVSQHHLLSSVDPKLDPATRHIAPARARSRPNTQWTEGSFTLFSRRGVEGLLHNHIESDHKAKRGSKKIRGQSRDISGGLVRETAYNVNQHRCDCRAPRNYKDSETDWWRTRSYSFSASVRIGQQER